MSLNLITGPAQEPVTLAEAKLHLRVTDSSEDALITSLISASRSLAEHETGRALITQTWERVLDAFPAAEIMLGRPTVLAITSITYLDTTGTLQTLSGSRYVLDADSPAGYVACATGYSWPDTIDAMNAVRVRFTAGYGALASAVPSDIKQWMLLQIGTMYANREGILITGRQPAELPNRFVGALLDRHRVYI